MEYKLWKINHKFKIFWKYIENKSDWKVRERCLWRFPIIGAKRGAWKVTCIVFSTFNAIDHNLWHLLTATLKSTIQSVCNCNCNKIFSKYAYSLGNTLLVIGNMPYRPCFKCSSRRELCQVYFSNFRLASHNKFEIFLIASTEFNSNPHFRRRKNKIIFASPQHEDICYADMHSFVILK